MRTVATIGVYGWTLKTFLEALRDANVALVMDVRQRRGVRGSDYAWANSQCVERDPEACHRSLIAERLADEHGVMAAHLRP